MKREVTKKDLFVGFTIIFLLGVILSIINGYHAKHTRQVFCPWVYVISILSLAIGGFIVLIFQWKIDKIQLNKILEVLPVDEKKVAQLIFAEKSITQSDLRYMTGLSKVKVSRIISKFEARGIVEKMPHGNTNLIISRL